MNQYPRRTFLRAAGVVGLTGAAGCAGFFDDGDGASVGTGRNGSEGETVIENFEDATLNGWTGSDNMQIIDTGAAVGNHCGGIVFDGSEESLETAKYDSGVGYTPENITFWIKTTHGENPDDEWSAYDSNDNRFLELHNHGDGGKNGTMVNGSVIANWIMNSKTWYKVSVSNISWSDKTIDSIQIIDSQGTEQLSWSDFDFHQSDASNFQKFEISNENANMNAPATTFADEIVLR